MADMRVVPPLQAPTISEVVLCDHRNTLTLFAHFFKAAAAAEAATAAGSEASPERLMLKLSAGALALDFHLHAKAEEQVMYPALQAHCGPEGALLAEHAGREHRELSREVDAVLGILLEDHDRLLAGQPMPVAELLVKRRQLIKRMQELEQVSRQQG
ncbi:Hemerythrin HHE cation binding domain [Chlorella sorokiniana]|uniref:Hemerythrin HHE cation binding domain n=1 Tax=Chlorella sorokiniana TaxID=3076 RepID=A0A2P6TQI7_CHLSO|nr:Hemerythrin HHE cation binding domain [Chlorella sorokiniana]|eukprot:PRW56298.1 Hemerythrin HHE cation binding domain [Chlorella sorokiniana]